MRKFNFQTKKPHWLLLPLSSGILLSLPFYPFDVWPFIFIAFAPLIYFVVGMPERTTRELFIGGFIAGGISALSFSYPFFGQFHWIKETYLFESIVRLFFIPATLIGGVSFGAMSVATRFLSRRSVAFNALIFSALFALWLLTFQRLIGGFNYFDPAFAAASVPALVKSSGIGGTPLVTFIILLINSFFALLFVGKDRKRLALVAIVAASVFLIALFAHERYLKIDENATEVKTVPVATIQISDRGNEAFGFVGEDGSFQYPLLEERVKEAVSAGAELIIYPFSPVSGAIAINGIDTIFNKKVLVIDVNTFSAWVKKNIPPSKVFLTWNSTYENGSFFNEYSFWKDGELYKRYQKREPLPFADYTPRWAAQKGFYSTPFDVKKGDIPGPVLLGNYSVGNLICSEIRDNKLVEDDAQTSSFIIAGGSDAMFSGDIAGRVNLINAQYRAAENNVPVVRANRLGPSAFIRSDGKIMSKMGYNKDGVFLERMPTETNKRKTIYMRFGDTPLLIFLLFIILVSIALKFKK